MISVGNSDFGRVRSSSRLPPTGSSLQNGISNITVSILFLGAINLFCAGATASPLHPTAPRQRGTHSALSRCLARACTVHVMRRRIGIGFIWTGCSSCQCADYVVAFCFMSVSHFHDPTAASQNVGNHVGNRPCVRQSQLFRRNESGNAMKELMGQTCLQWDTKRLQGAYSGAAFDPNSLKVQQAVQGRPPPLLITFFPESLVA